MMYQSYYFLKEELPFFKQSYYNQINSIICSRNIPQGSKQGVNFLVGLQFHAKFCRLLKTIFARLYFHQNFAFMLGHEINGNAQGNEYFFKQRYFQYRYKKLRKMQSAFDGSKIKWYL